MSTTTADQRITDAMQQVRSQAHDLMRAAVDANPRLAAQLQRLHDASLQLGVLPFEAFDDAELSSRLADILTVLE